MSGGARLGVGVTPCDPQERELYGQDAAAVIIDGAAADLMQSGGTTILRVMVPMPPVFASVASRVLLTPGGAAEVISKGLRGAKVRILVDRTLLTSEVLAALAPIEEQQQKLEEQSAAEALASLLGGNHAEV